MACGITASAPKKSGRRTTAISTPRATTRGRFVSTGCTTSRCFQKNVEGWRPPDLINRMEQHLESGHPIGIAFYEPPDYGMQNVRLTGILSEQPPRKDAPAHAVLITGYDRKEKRFLIRNSQGAKGWGSLNNGYGTMPYLYATDPRFSFSIWAIKLKGESMSNNIHVAPGDPSGFSSGTYINDSQETDWCPFLAFPDMAPTSPVPIRFNQMVGVQPMVFGSPESPSARHEGVYTSLVNGQVVPFSSIDQVNPWSNTPDNSGAYECATPVAQLRARAFYVWIWRREPSPQAWHIFHWLASEGSQPNHNIETINIHHTEVNHIDVTVHATNGAVMEGMTSYAGTNQNQMGLISPPWAGQCLAGVSAGH